ncbi:UDP-glucose 4-epimerase protein [Marine Group I thaumarchaeote SCGC AAA799-B03]|uniref:UDP-glucose 4-epimerase protein n=1 Tax=Marine Group I thaumarchaeote SCGC AAA799-B03 TaxID=1502289 RepID=A0A087S908_9ARCH|nr:UDP-glucose 4-epimerase protein [Marine Group I thaumarchaeote SCGC AAA799-B03]
MSKILVTGGAGFIGSALVKKLAVSHDVVVFDNEFRGSFENLSGINVEQIKGDITNFSDWEKLPNDIDSVFHFGAINGTGYFYTIPEQVLDVNVKGVVNMIDYVKKYSIKDVLFASSSEVYGFPTNFPTSEKEPIQIPTPLNPRYSYSGSKIIGELLCVNNSQKYNFRYTIVRYHNVYGPKMGHEHVIPQFVKKLVSSDDFTIQGDGQDTRSFCFIDDAIDATIMVHNDNTITDRIFNIGNPEEVTILQLIKKLSDISGKNIQPKSTPQNNSGTKRRVPDITKAESCGYSPKIPLIDGLKITYDWYKTYYLNSH